MKKLIIILALALSAATLTGQNTSFVTKHGRMDRSKLNVGAYILQGNSRSEAHIKDVADCGIDFMMYMNNDTAALNLFSKYGVGAILVGTVPLWWGGFGDNAGTLQTQHPISEYEAGAAKFTDHPAIWGICIVDEPSCLDFPYIGEVTTRMEALFPNQFTHINLHPIYAPGPRTGNDPARGALGTASYQDYIDQYCKYVPTDFISYDFYYQNGGVQQDYANMRIVSEACRRTGRSMWVTVQVNSAKLEEWISENQLRFQAYSAMAYGAENITWACYCFGWWYNQVLYGDGSKTQQYDKLKKVNAEIHTLGERYMKYRNDSTYCTGFTGLAETMIEGSGMVNSERYDDGVFSDIDAGGCPLLVGKMSARNGGRKRALFICPAGDPYDVGDLNFTLRFKSRRRVRITGGDGPIPAKRKCGGWYEIPIKPNQGLLIETK
ncbi:MAG: hypothetical protein IKN31_07085 [Bacteroidales bacterium]|nr:hypothetical protein [Bacteroidales bacterium]